MKITGKQMLDAVARRLNEENVRCYDNAIVAKINSLTAPELAQLTDFGDVTAWHNDRVEKEQEEKLRAEGTI
jgi:hypothetical protein